MLAVAASLPMLPNSALAFAGISVTESCAALTVTPQRFVRHRDQAISYRISNNFIARYPDDFSQYLVEDAARWWQDYISGFLWTDDIHDRFSYYRKDNNSAVYELKSVLMHEFGHAMGMQHSDACYYNINGATNMPWLSNHRSIGGGNVAVQPTVGPELMNETWVYSSPGAKSNAPIDGYNRTPGLDGFEFVNYAYPFSPLSLVKTNNAGQDILIDSTDVGSSGGQTSYPGGFTPIVNGDTNQGWYMDGVNIWVGNNIGIRNRTESWYIENTTGAEINQITLRVNGSSTRRAISETAPAAFDQFNVGNTSSPEQLIYGWTTPFNNRWQPGNVGWLIAEVDVHDWVVQEALAWVNSNEVYELALPGIVPVVPWGLTTPETPPPGQIGGFQIPTDAPSEPTPVPNAIELIAPSFPPQPSGKRGFQLVLPQVPGIQIQQLELLVLDWDETELMMRQDAAQRNQQLLREFDNRRRTVIDLLRPFRGSSQRPLQPADIGLHPDERLLIKTNDNPRAQRAPLAGELPLDLADRYTYALRLVSTTAAGRVTTLSLPEMTTYNGANLARCSAASDAASCCPTSMSNPLTVTAPQWHSGDLRQPACIVAAGNDQQLELKGGHGHLLAAGDGKDHVVDHNGSSVIILGAGDDHYQTTGSSGSRVIAGAGNDRLEGSVGDDDHDGGAGDDWLISGPGNDQVIGGPGDDVIDSGDGNDWVAPGSGVNTVDAGNGDDMVVVMHACEIEAGSTLRGGSGIDTLILPVSRSKALALGLIFSGFEKISENIHRDSYFADCE
ncbi:MAG: hypothetical protein Tsb002_38140 [Wenzhouxiangellaceae bacterium]